MAGSKVRKQDSDFTVITKLIARELRAQTTATTPRSANMVQNYTFGSGGGSFGSGAGGGDATTGNIRADTTTGTVNRSKIQASGAVYIEDNAGDNAVRVSFDKLADPMTWLL